MANWMSSVVSTIAGGAASAVSAIASSAASVVVEKIVNDGMSYLSNRMLPADSDAELKRLQKALPQIREVMSIAEAMKVIDPRFGAWFEQFRNAVEESEDVLDQLEYKELEDMVKIQDEAGASTTGLKKRKLFRTNDDTLRRMREAVRMLDQAAANVDRIHLRAAELGVCSLSEIQREVCKFLKRETTSFLIEGKVFGREIEKSKIIDWIKKSTDHHFSGLSIVGPGGLGKTTLAQFAYQEIRGTNHFDKYIWISVSTNFDVNDITIKILDELRENTDRENNDRDKALNTLHEDLKEKIYSKKIFIVLDDVWEDERRGDWEKLFAPFKFVQKGSKILFTTRMKSVEKLLASVINTEHESLKLEGLGDEDLRSVFNTYAFHGYGSNDHGDLQEIGNKIIKMLKGNPLAAKVIGSLLNSYMDRQYWSKFLSHDSLFNIEQAKDVMEVLKLSYYHLPTDLQACFKFCSIFRQDYWFTKDELVKMWMAAGFINQQSGQEKPEDIGNDYFNHLLRKSFFEHAESSRDLREIYVMHDLLYELAQNIANGECCRIEPNDKKVVIPSSVRHISIPETEIERISHLKNLRSLVIFTPSSEIKLDPFVLPTKLINRNLRLLKISTVRSCKLPEEISMLAHLRYLSIIHKLKSFKHFLPTSINSLYLLQVLEIKAYPTFSCYLRIETTRITNLFRLRYLSLSKKIMQTIRGVHKLTSLRDLTFYVGKENGNCIQEIGALNNLQNLSICNIEHVGNPAEAKSANLSKKENLMSLFLKWTRDSNAANQEQIIDNLQPHPNLMKLTIKNYKGQRPPSWMEDSQPSKLLSLRLYSCPMWENGFISLKMPYLKILEISNLPKLEKIPNMPLSLCEFRIQKVGLTSLPDLYECSDNNTTISQKSQLRIVDIRECPSLKSLNGFLQQANMDLQAIEKLLIENCKGLVHLPSQGFGNLTSLNYLTLRNCPKLLYVELHGNLLPEKVQDLYMGNCGELDVSILKVSSGLTNLTSLIVSNSENIASITVSHSSFRSLKRLKICMCAKLVELSFSEAEYGVNQNNNFNFSKMVDLHVSDCPNLTIFPKLPLSLTSFTIFNVGVSALPKHSRSSDSIGGPSTTPQKSSLRKVHIENCQNLRSVNEFLQQETIKFQFLESLYIDNCKSLVQLPIGAFEKFVSLTRIVIRDCSMLVVDVQSNLLPLKLEYLTIGNCGEFDVALLQSASHITTLIEVSICSSKNITHIPCSENAFKSLRSLRIIGCDKLVEDSSREHALGNNLQMSNFPSFKITHLEIDHFTLLLIEPLRSLRFVSSLFVNNCSVMATQTEQWLLQNNSTLRVMEIRKASSLKSIPDTMMRLTALESLLIFQADLLEELPKLPSSLKSLRISGARSLKSLPPTMASLTALEELYIYNADLLEELPELPPSLCAKRVRGSGGRLL